MPPDHCQPRDGTFYLIEAMDIGDRILVLGLVTETNLGSGGRPLLYHRGRFGRFTPHA
jgi:hypothetical protein